MTRMLLICHAEGMHNRYSSLLNDDLVDESGLTAVGWEQSNAVADWLKRYESVDILASGRQLHSRLTAQRIGQALGLPVTVAQELPARLSMDLAFPDIDTPPDELDPEIHTSTHNAVVEPYVEFHHALISTLTKLLSEHIGQTIAVVTSESAIATVLRHFFGAHRLQVRVDHTSLSEIDHENGQWSLRYVNRTEHIPRRPRERSHTNTQLALTVSEDEDLTLIAQVYNEMARSLRQNHRLSSSGRMQGEWGDAILNPTETMRIQSLIRYAGFPLNSRVLDVGSGTGQLALALAQAGIQEVVGIDVSLAMLEYAEYMRLNNPPSIVRSVSFRLAPAQLMPFRNGRFEAVVCRLVLNHARHPETILREMARVMVPGGMLVLADLLTAEDPVKRATHNAIESRRNPSHIAAHTADQYRALVVDAGLEIISEQEIIFERELEEWIASMIVDATDRAAVREMVEAGLETDAAGINARRVGDRLIFDQRINYLKVRKL